MSGPQTPENKVTPSVWRKLLQRGLVVLFVVAVLHELGGAMARNVEAQISLRSGAGPTGLELSNDDQPGALVWSWSGQATAPPFRRTFSLLPGNYTLRRSTGAQCRFSVPHDGTLRCDL